MYVSMFRLSLVSRVVLSCCTCPEAGREDSGVAVGEPRVGDLDLFFAVTRTGRSLRRLGRLFLRECILLHSFLGNGVERVAH